MGSTLSSEKKYAILVRHGSRDFTSDYNECKQSMRGWSSNARKAKPDFETKGLPLTLAMAHRLADELGPVRITQVWHSPHKVAAQTAEAYRLALKIRERCNCNVASKAFLDPDMGSAMATTDSVRELAASKTLGAGSAVLLTGHQPMLTYVAADLTRNRLPVGILPLGGSEAACLELRGNGDATLIWMLTAKSPDLMQELKDKIKSKYDVAKFFLGAFVVNTGFMLSSAIWGVSDPWAKALVLLGFVLALVALALTAATLTSYDSLLMPTEFWGEGLSAKGTAGQNPRPKSWSVLRPPSQAQIVLFYEMVHVWNAFFIPALVCAFAAVTVFLVALIHGKLFMSDTGEWAFDAATLGLVLVAIVAAGAFALPYLHYRRNQPHFGSED